jgi:TonB family protein
MHRRRWISIAVAMAALSSSAQQTTNPTGEADPPATQPDGVPASDHVYHIAGNVQKPVIVSTVKPQFTEQARRNQFSGDVMVYLIVEKDGTPSHIRVVKSLGMGLDEKTIEAVKQYRFKPATFMGQPIRVDLYLDVNFRLQ